jgi:hypothetical protein
MGNFTSNPLQPVLKKLAELEDEAKSSAFVQITRTDTEIVVDADRLGLIHLAARLLSLAEQQSPGSHFHFDRVSIAGPCDIPIIVCYLDNPTDVPNPQSPTA